ncbi:LysR family transcriptional regulator substrate-binding protein [[Ruminococcus] lactaris]|uniref:LysR family transcriptional regulator substrate-binding protein n=1 Tax=[Ruminococcus] lactaris TaxID=46228 RepID=UPI003078BA75
MWERYHNAYPNVSLDLRQSYTLKMADALQAGKLDLFIGVDVPAASNLNMIPLASEYLFCLIHDNILKECCPNHWQELLNKSATEGLDVSDLKDFPILLLASDNRIRSLLDRAYDRCGIMPKTILEASDQNIIYQLACSGQGAAFLPPMILFNHQKGAITWPENCHCLRMNHSFSKIDISLVYRNDLILPHYAEGMKKAITQEFHSYAMAMKPIS